MKRNLPAGIRLSAAACEPTGTGRPAGIPDDRGELTKATPNNCRASQHTGRAQLVMAGEGPPSTTCVGACGKVVDADLRRHDGGTGPRASNRFVHYWASPNWWV